MYLTSIGDNQAYQGRNEQEYMHGKTIHFVPWSLSYDVWRTSSLIDCEASNHLNDLLEIYCLTIQWLGLTTDQRALENKDVGWIRHVNFFDNLTTQHDIHPITPLFASDMSWVTNTQAAVFGRLPIKDSNTKSRSGSRPLVGSSATTNSGSNAVHAQRYLRCSPPDISW